MGPLDALFSTPEQRLLGVVLTNPEKDFGTLELLQRMGNSRSAGSAMLKRWVASGLLTERRIGNQRRLAANPDFLLYQELRQIALKTVALAQPLAHALSPIADKLDDAFVFGSVAAGKDASDSDIDLVVVGDVDLFTVSPLLDAFERELRRPVHVNVYSLDEWSSNGDPVLQTIKNGPRIAIPFRR